jgi:hypothetical protein
MRNFFFFLLFAVMSSAAQAVPVYWTPNDIQFYRPGLDLHSFSGSFAYDADTGTVSSVYVSVAGLPTNPLYTYGFDATGTGETLYFTANQVNSVAELENYSGLILKLQFQSALTNAGGTALLADGLIPPDNLLVGSGEGTSDCLGPGFCFVAAVYSSTYDTNLYSGGSFTGSTVPIPAAVWLFGSALGILAWLRRRVRVR